MAYHAKLKKKAPDAKRQIRKTIISECLLKGMSYRQMAVELQHRLDLPKPVSLKTIHDDVDALYTEWHEIHDRNMTDHIELELQRINWACSELEEQWQKSKENRDNLLRKKKGRPRKDGGTGDASLQVTDIEEQKTSNFGLGNPAYITEMRNQLVERRKLLGLYAPEKQEVSGDLSFAYQLMRTAIQTNDAAEPEGEHND